MLDKIVELEKNVKYDLGVVKNDDKENTDYYEVLKKFIKSQKEYLEYDVVSVRYYKITDGYSTIECVYFALCHVLASSSLGYAPIYKLTIE